MIAVVAAQWLLVALAGTDIPFHDQWDYEGRWLYPAWGEGRLGWLDWFSPTNDHRVLWTNLLNVALLALNGQWDPLVQMMAIVGLRAACVAVLAWEFCAAFTGRWCGGAVAGLMLAFAPHLAWHTVLWGVQTHTYFAILFSYLALNFLGGGEAYRRRIGVGVLFGLAALVAMGPAALMPLVLIVGVMLRAAEQRAWSRDATWRLGAALALLGVALWLRVEPPGAAEWKPTSPGEFLAAAGRALAWPHVGQPLAAIAMNVPLVLLVGLRLARRRTAQPGEDFVILAGGWSAAIALASAWMRGGGAELSVGVPSRYVDFLIALPLANAWSAAMLAREATGTGKARGRWLAVAWGTFLVVGWVGLSSEVLRRLILPRVRDREAPVRLMQAYQKTGNVDVFAGQPRLLVPHPHPESSVRAVLDDSRLRGRLPPSLQPDRSLGPLSRGARVLLGQPTAAPAPRN